MQSTAGSTILLKAVAQALIRGLRMDSDSAREYSTGPPSLSGPGIELSGSESDGDRGDFEGEVSLSRRDLHW